ncbi:MULTISPECIES: hypothetical protein [Rhodopseudomonas]|uniref:hypothetical protein n=1 Tax=Rhodopseudomonas TaxID=1073 RepID=UPI00136495B0|nr:MULTISPECIES: hypothetical protein [Rhodopseudomonas]MDF3813135.1 hypothetical protein [Rhodopseudomonas sp. BAL398]WOK16736.1 hypothetical protein RBJ75_21735 [Rhodopseudomonas sp. BAL398]
MESWAASVAAFSYARLAQQVAKTGPADAAACNNAIEGADPAAATAFGYAYDLTLESQAFEYRFGRGTMRRVQLRGIEISEANLDPRIWIGGLANTQAVAVADIAHGPGEGGTWSGRKPAFTWVCVGRHRRADGHRSASNQHSPHAQAAFFSAPLLFFLVSNTRANLSHFAMAARFSGM